jgi:hypothetical protein
LVVHSSFNPPTTSRESAKPRWVWAFCAALWLTSAAGGLWVLWAWDNQPGASAHALVQWPADSGLVRETGTPTIVMLLHPQCTCSRATVTELAEILARARTRPKTYVFFLKPAGFADGWEQTDLWRAAAALPGVTVIRDDDGKKAARFGAETSGQTFLYDADGALLFSGGITGARAHAGENAGRTSVLALLNRAETGRSATTSVFGCPLFTRAVSRSSNE